MVVSCHCRKCQVKIALSCYSKGQRSLLLSLEASRQQHIHVEAGGIGNNAVIWISGVAANSERGQLGKMAYDSGRVETGLLEGVVLFKLGAELHWETLDKGIENNGTVRLNLSKVGYL